MAIKIKGSSVSGRTPLPADLLERQLAVNTADGYLFTKHSDGTIKDIKVKVADSATNATNAVNATTAATCTGNAGTVTNGVYTTGDQTIAGVKTFSSSPIAPTPTVGDRTTKVATTTMFDTEFSKSLSTNGWQKLPSGLIIQWGYSGWACVTFPIAFPNACRAVLNQFDGGAHEHGVSSVTTTGFCPTTNGAVSNFYWLAIGY
jgi:hypothetical protein